MMDVTRGQPRVRIWPPPRKTRPTQAEIDLRYAFKEAVRTAKRWPADQQAKYREAVAGTALLPTDLIMMTIYGNAFAITLDGEKVLYSMQTRAKVSESLDVISQTPGALLFRGQTFWGEAAPGAEGQVLIMGADGVPYWATVDPGITLESATVAADQGTASGGYTDLATAGPSVTILHDTEVLITLCSGIYKSDGGPGCNGWMAVDVSGANTIAPTDSNGWTWSAMQGGGFGDQPSRTFKLSGLTPGISTFKAMYRVNCATFHWFNRDITVQAL